MYVDMKKFEALGDNIIIRNLPEGNTTESGLIIIGNSGVLNTHPNAIVVSSKVDCIPERGKIKYSRHMDLLVYADGQPVSIVMSKDVVGKYI